VLDELVSGAVTKTYTYGLQRISENQLSGSTWTPTFYGYDGHGNVRFAAWKIEYNEERPHSQDTARRESLRRRRQWASTQLSERQGTQPPSLAPRAPHSG